MTIRPSVFDRAADHLEKYGWMKEDYFPGGSAIPFDDDDDDFFRRMKRNAAGKPCCALGVLYAKTRDNEDFKQHSRFLASIVDPTWGDVPGWNDRKSRRKRDVIRALRRAAEKARQER